MSDKPFAPEDGTGQPAEALPTLAPSWILQGSLFKAMRRLALPMVIGGILDDTYNLVDMFWVGQLGSAAMAAVSICGMIMGTVAMLGFGVATGSLALVARFMGMRRRDEAGRVVAQAIVLAVLIGVITALFGTVVARGFIRLLGGTDAVVRHGTPYLVIVALGSTAGYLGFVLNSALRASGDAVTPMIVSGIGNVLNCILDPLLIFGLLGLPRMGVAGAALATVATQSVATAIMFYIFFVRGHEHFHLRLRDLKPDWPMMWRIIRIGVFGSGQALVRNLSAMAVLRIVAQYGGHTAQAAFGIVMRIWFAVLTAGLGFGNAAATLVGQNLGARQPQRAARAGWLGAGTFAAISAGLGAFFIIFPTMVVRTFNKDPDVVGAGATFMLLMGATMPFMCLSVVLGRALQGAGDTLWPMLITTFAMLVFRLPLAYLLALNMGTVTGAWIAFSVSNLVQGSLFAAWFGVGRWKHKKV